ncbi:hypothetical protein EYF80_062677 [Liparis tanakae]|uniref:Uncharacterized protein n=1 Tax=Liparis tanakae TaxID=230148 RepID=A0A4Z2EF52_9TELE|nr:hypothetical protein EYF80_062677 [Liparis tanakae]
MLRMCDTFQNTGAYFRRDARLRRMDDGSELPPSIALIARRLRGSHLHAQIERRAKVSAARGARLVSSRLASRLLCTCGSPDTVSHSICPRARFLWGEKTREKTRVEASGGGVGWRSDSSGLNARGADCSLREESHHGI